MTPIPEPISGGHDINAVHPIVHPLATAFGVQTSKLVDRLDKFASSLEDLGCVEEAERIDILSNTIEAMSLEGAADKLKESYEKAYSNAHDRLDLKKLAWLLQLDAGKLITPQYLTERILPEIQKGSPSGWRNAAQRLQNEKDYAVIESVMTTYA